jgi:hypothetical protein
MLPRTLLRRHLVPVLILCAALEGSPLPLAARLPPPVPDSSHLGDGDDYPVVSPSHPTHAGPAEGVRRAFLWIETTTRIWIQYRIHP